MEIQNEHDGLLVMGKLVKTLAELKIHLCIGVTGLLVQTACGSTVEQLEAVPAAQAQGENPQANRAPSASPAEMRRSSNPQVNRGGGDGDFIAYEYH